MADFAPESVSPSSILPVAKLSTKDVTVFNKLDGSHPDSPSDFVLLPIPDPDPQPQGSIFPLCDLNPAKAGLQQAVAMIMMTTHTG